MILAGTLLQLLDVLLECVDNRRRSSDLDMWLETSWRTASYSVGGMVG